LSAPAGGELRTRFVLGPLMLAAIGGVYWLDATRTDGVLSAIVLGLLGLGGVFEYVAMLQRGGFAVSRGLLIAMSAALFASAPFFGWSQTDRELYPLVLATMLLLFPLALRDLTADRMQRGLETQGASLLGFVLIAWPVYFGQGIALRHVPALLFVVLVCKGGDIGGYLAGVAFGRHKLIPHISKGKTIEGSIGSMLASCAIALALWGALRPPGVELGLTAIAGMGIMLNLAAQTGDLVESLLKRRCGVKDSSRLLPAHGGVLDLIDSLLLAMPAWFLVLVRLT
jgi:phosphatidate cytidylyltransferase